MPSVKSGWSTSSSISPGLRIGAGVAVAVLHAAVAAALFVSDETKLDLPQDAPIMVSVVEAPIPQMAKADPTPEQPQPPVEEPPPPPPQEQTPPDTKPDPTPDVKPEPEPEPEPVIEKPPEPAPKPKPKPKPKPQPKPQPKKETPPPKPVETPPPPAPPSGTPQGDSKPQAPTQGPPPDQPETVSNVTYDGRGPRPVYSETSRRMREEGRVMVLVVINAQGTIEKATVVQSSGYPRLDQAALDALRVVHFKPYTRNGVAYTVQAKIPFDFKMRN